MKTKFNEFLKESKAYWGEIEITSGNTNNYLIQIEQIGKTRDYRVLLNGEFIGNIRNNINYSNNSIDSILQADAENLVYKLLKKPYFTKTEFVGEINHVVNP